MFTSLYVKTNYSLLSSLVSIDNLILYAVEHKLSALAICDDNILLIYSMRSASAGKSERRLW